VKTVKQEFQYSIKLQLFDDQILKLFCCHSITTIMVLWHRHEFVGFIPLTLLCSPLTISATL